MAQIKNRLNQNGRRHVLETSRAKKSVAGIESRLHKSHTPPCYISGKVIFSDDRGV